MTEWLMNLAATLSDVSLHPKESKKDSEYYSLLSGDQELSPDEC